MGNTFKTAFLLTALTLLLMGIGRAFGGQNGMLLALGVAAVTNFVAYFFSDKIALATYRAQPVTRDQLPRVYEVVERMTQRIGLPMPKIYVIPTDSPNAFATGRNPAHASVAVTEGILNLLNDEELAGVLAHELGHVSNRDILISSIAATIAGAITFGCSSHVDSGSHCCLSDPACGLAFPRISGRRHRRALHRQSVCFGERVSETRCLFQARAVSGDAIHCSSLYYSAVPGHELRQLVLDPSSDC